MGVAMPRVLPATYVYMDKVMDIERTMRTALQVRSCLRSFGASQCFNPPSKKLCSSLQLPICYQSSHLSSHHDCMDMCMQAMPPDEFINILRPVFQQDEIKLIIVGGILGAAAGAVQQFAIFSLVS